VSVLVYIAAALTLLAVGALLVFPTFGVCVALIARPLIDATYADKLVGHYALTELIGVAMPLAVFAFAAVRASGPQRFSRIPLFPIWLIYALDVVLFSAILAANEGIEAGANILFRQLNVVAAYYLGQAFFRQERTQLLLLRVLLLATLFPLAIGLYQFLTGYQWVHADTEGITRYVGLYHDAFTVRYYMMQGILAAGVLLMLPGSRVRNILLWAFIVCALLVMYRAYSKSAIATIFIWALMWGILRRKFVPLAVLGVVAVIAIGVYAPQVADQVGTMFHKEIGALHGQVDLSHTFAGRWYGWRELLSKWDELDAFAKVFGSHTAVGAHNDFLMMLMHGGLLGLLIYLLLLGSVGLSLARNALERADPVALAGLMAFSLWCIDAIGLVPSSYPGYQWFVWAVIGMSMRSRLDARRAAQHKRRAARAAAAAPAFAARPDLVAPT
jgi:O-antigen ligase